MNHTKCIRLRNLLSFPYCYFILFFCKKKIFYSKNTNYANSFYGNEMYVNLCRGVFRTQQITYDGAFFEKSLKSFIVDVRLGSKYASGISFMVEKMLQTFVECQYLSCSQSQKFVIDLLIS